ncbi:MAG: HD domain-containing protein [Treponema sp.]|jgi:putative nucleotidyltransferase with HDIG domain|nr:HD domain-containing protein [Treponema sp.]
MDNARIHPLLREIAAVFQNYGRDLYLVGGAVRDLCRGEKPQDWDLATNAPPEEVMTMFRRVIPTGIRHGTVTVHYKGQAVEVTTFRTESEYRDGRRPGKVEFAATIGEDLSRRDFTMNAIALRLPEGSPVDPFGGAADIKKRLIRCVGDPNERFSEDGLRPLRAVRFAATLGFSLDTAALDAVRPALTITAKVSPERIRDELDKILGAGAGSGAGRPSTAFRLMERTGLLDLLIPELAACRGVEQKGYHQFDVLDHSLLACDYASRERYPRQVILAALFHDLGKPATRKAGERGIWTFYQHEKESVRLCRKILTRLRYPNAVIDETCHLIGEHMFHYTEDWSGAAVRRFIIRVGEEHLENLYRLRQADTYAMAGLEPDPASLLPLIQRVDGALAGNRAFSLKDLAVSGKDLIEIGVKPGKHMGIILKELFETVVNDPSMNSREKLLEIAGKINERYL